jgi:predicted negative regulator of RcsB-dependent stress response
MKIKKVVPKAMDAEVQDGETPDPEDELILPSVIAPPPDQMVTAGTETLTWMNRNRAAVAGGLAILTLLVIFVSVRLQTSNERRAEQAQPVLTALGAAMAPSDGLLDREAQILAAVGDATSNARLGDGATLLVARAHLAQGDAAAAREGYQRLTAGESTIGVSLVARVGAADAAAASGDLDAALSMVDALGADLGEAWALRRRAELLDAYGTAARALEAWRLAAETADPQMAPVISNRIARLEIDLGLPAEGQADPSDTAN